MDKEIKTTNNQSNEQHKDGYNLSMTNDLVFKAVFGRDDEECKLILKHLLNLILERDKDPIKDVQYKNPFNIREYADDKEEVMDIKVTTGAGEIIDLEMQMVKSEFIERRMVDYHANLITSSLKKGERYGNMKPTISIWIVDDHVHNETDDYISEFYFIEKNRGFMLTDITHIICIELPKNKREKHELNELSQLELFLELIRCGNEEGGEYVEALIQAGGEILQMANEMMKKVTADEIMREKAIAREKFQRYIYSAIEDGKAVAEAKGKEEGKVKKTFEIAVKMKQADEPLEKIIAYTGLTIEQIEEL